MMKKIIFSQGLFILALLLFSGCKKRTENLLGPEYGGVPENFSVAGNQFQAFNISKSTGNMGGTPATSVALNANYQCYKASFSDKVRWKLTIRSWKTHARKEFSGYSDFIDENNTKWDGGSDNDYFFGYSLAPNDSVEVKLSFVGTDYALYDTIRITGQKSYHRRVYNGIYHFLVDDFEGGNDTTQFSSFYIDAADLGGGNTGNNGYTGEKNQGRASYHMYGIDANNNTYIGSCNTPTLNDIKLNTFTVTDPNELFFNLYIFGTGRSNTTVSVITFENDSEYAPGATFDQSTNDKYIYQIGVDWTGWKLVSFRYSGFRKPNTGGGLGNNRLNPERISGLALELDSYPTAGMEVEAMVDMVVITERGVFQK